MEGHEMDLVVEETTENVDAVSTEELTGQEEQIEQVEEIEQQSEEPVVKTYTKEEVDQIVGRRLAREREKARKENEHFEELGNVLKAGTGKESVEDITAMFREHYQNRGVKIPERATFSDRDVATLAKADAAEIIEAGLEEVIEETERLSKKGVQNMTPREKLIYSQLAEHRQAEERKKELLAMGVKGDVLESKEFKEYASMFNKETPITKIYEMYAKATTPQVERIGSLSNGAGPEEKTTYTPEEVDKLTKEDWDNPVILKRVRESMLQWKQ